jgi:hypothetical protein
MYGMGAFPRAALRRGKKFHEPLRLLVLQIQRPASLTASAFSLAVGKLSAGDGLMVIRVEGPVSQGNNPLCSSMPLGAMFVRLVTVNAIHMPLGFHDLTC